MDEPWDDWEVAADADLEPKPGRITDDHEKNKQIWQEANAFAQPEIIRTNSTRTEYVPQLHILKRPKNPGSTTTTHSPSIDDANGSSNGAQHKKSLADREAEYVIARQKIFGENNVTHENITEFEIANDGERNEIQKEKVVDLQGDNGKKNRMEDIRSRKPLTTEKGATSEGLYSQNIDILRQPRSPNNENSSGFNRGTRNPKS
ncbi:1185_t:CDS:2 [Acaulospora morrowiae]|uniref:1185_t:CDS:1 n=1 Tax=Acaulospora morrowiae TaxID=94023 RepID=A0A9N9CLW0_9GLOM|nr:1185_t:CDS:2 [Acaulospora morrowiae]